MNFSAVHFLTLTLSTSRCKRPREQRRMQQIYLSRGARAPELWTHAAVFDGTAVA